MANATALHSDHGQGSYGFSPQQYAELKECFILFDPSNKGAMLGSDLGRALRAMGQNPSESDVAKMLQSAVLDDAGCLSLDEYMRVVGQYKLKDESEMQDEFIEALRVFDRQDVGALNVAELRAALKNYGEGLPDGELDEIFALANVKEDGTFDYSDFVSKIVCK